MRFLCEVLAKLIGTVLPHDFLVADRWRHDDRSLRRAAIIRPYAAAFAGLPHDKHVVASLVEQLLIRLDAAPIKAA